MLPGNTRKHNNSLNTRYMGLTYGVSQVMRYQHPFDIIKLPES